MADLIIADVSEWQGVVDWAAYANGGYPAAVARLTYGTGHVDLQADQNIVGMRAHLRCRGWYGYLVATQDPAAQAQVFVKVLQAHGGLQPGEFVVVDVEEGAGPQEPRAEAWLATVNQGLSITQLQDVEYSGLNFAAVHDVWVPGVKRWVAAYQATEPAVGQTFWQATDARSFPGIAHPCDASVFHGTIDQLLALVTPAPPPATVPKGTAVYSPPLHLQDIASSLSWPHGGVILLGVDGSIYNFGGAPFLKGANGQPYFTGRVAKELDYRPATGAGSVAGYGEGYTIIDSAGERYQY